MQVSIVIIIYLYVSLFVDQIFVIFAGFYQAVLNMDSSQEVKKNMRVEITNEVRNGNIIKYTAIQLPFVNKMAHCAVGANSENTVYLILRSPNVCVQNKFLFALVVKMGGILLFNDFFKRISSCNMVVLLDQLTLDDLNEIKPKNANKIYFEAILTIKCEKLNPLQRLLNDIASPELADFTFKVEEKTFQAHKFILSARSPVFARMLSNKNYKETQQSVMTITDTPKDVFKIFLDFIYNADIPVVTIYGATELIKLAEKYDLGDLKNICENVLISKLTLSDSVYEIYMFAHQYNCSQELIAKAFQFVEGKYFVGKTLPPNLCSNPAEVQRLVTKMKEFDEALQKVHADLKNPTKKMKAN